MAVSQVNDRLYPKIHECNCSSCGFRKSAKSISPSYLGFLFFVALNFAVDFWELIEFL